MKANEIRVGNIFIGYDDKPFVWGLKEFSFIEPDVAISIDEIIKSPILLSEEILLKCGFESGSDDGNHWWFTKGDITINFSSWTGIFEFEWQNIEMKHLHQLQNLYYSLTGEEFNTSGL